MAKEIEPRFLLPAMPDLGTTPIPIIQGYLCTDPARTVRVRQIGDEGKITIKGPRVNGEGDEYEYDIPASDLAGLFNLCGAENTLGKNRHEWPAGNLTWEVDQFTGRHDGLVIAEIELPSRDTPYTKPDWLKGVDITDDFRFANSVLTQITREELIQNIRSALEPAGFAVNLKL